MNNSKVYVPVITVDGLTGSGKTTLSYRLAKHLGWHWLNSGSFYRAAAYAALQAGICLTNEIAVAKFVQGLNIDLRVDGECSSDFSVLLNGKPFTRLLNSHGCGSAASEIGALPKVRKALLNHQLSFRSPPGLVADGRDMGTVVFPDAALKIFLKASSEERAKRRYNQLKSEGLEVDLSTLMIKMSERDRRDRLRDFSPLKPAKEAFIMDTTDLDPDVVITQVLKRWHDRSI